MSKTSKIWLAVAAVLVLIGLIVFAIAMSVNHWDFTKLGTFEYETNSYTLSEDINNITIKTDTSDIVFSSSEDGTCKVVCFEPKDNKHSVYAEGDTLSINSADTKEWYKNIGINFHSPKITVFLPKTQYSSLLINESTGNIEIPGKFSFENADIITSTGDVEFRSDVSGNLKIKLSTGDIEVENISANTLDLSVSTGEIDVSDVKCKIFSSNGTTGDVSLENLIATEKISIERSTGEVRFDKCDAGELFVKSTTGDVFGTLLSEKVFITESSTGDVDVPKTTSGGKCEIKTSTGDITIKID